MKKKNNYNLAVGLEYDSKTDQAPQISVNAQQLMADEVVKIAKRFGVPIVEKKELARSLKDLEVDQQIPETLFEAVAIVLNQIEKKTASAKNIK